MSIRTYQIGRSPFPIIEDFREVMTMSASERLSRIKREVARGASADSALADRIAQYLADQNGDEVVPFYTRQADEIVAMVRETDRLLVTTLASHPIAAE